VGQSQRSRLVWEERQQFQKNVIFFKVLFQGPAFPMTMAGSLWGLSKVENSGRQAE
jgi:hypothetical protein